MAQALALLSPSLGCLRTMIHPEQTAVCTRRGFPNAGLLSFRLQITWEGELAERGLEGSSDKQVPSHCWGQKLLSSVAGATCKGIPRLSSGSHPPHVPLVWISSRLGECHVLLLIPSGCLAMLGDISGCHHWGWSHHWVIRGPGCSFTPTVSRTDPHDRGGSGPARQRCPGGTPCLPATPSPGTAAWAPSLSSRPHAPGSLPAPQNKQAGTRVLPILFLDFSRLSFVFCWKRAGYMSVLGNAAACNQKHTQTPSARPPETLTDLLVTGQTPLCSRTCHRPLAFQHTMSTPPLGQTDPQGPLFGSDTQMPQPEWLR